VNIRGKLHRDCSSRSWDIVVTRSVHKNKWMKWTNKRDKKTVSLSTSVRWWRHNNNLSERLPRYCLGYWSKEYTIPVLGSQLVEQERSKTSGDVLSSGSVLRLCVLGITKPSPFIIITHQPQIWYSFYHPMKGERLSCKSMLFNAICRSGCHTSLPMVICDDLGKC